MGKKKDDYFEFLYETGFEDYGNRSLALYLHSIPFEWTLERDENRMYDGLAMRREFEENGNDIPNEFKGSDHCTMLEFFVGFAYRLSRDMFEGDISTTDLIKMWFENLDIWKLEYDDWKVNQALDIWVNRTYNEDGSYGNIFVIPNCEDDLRDFEMWIQASWWYGYFRGT